MKYLKLFEDFNDYDPYELMIIPPNKKAEMLMRELEKDEPNLNLVSDLIQLGANLDWQDDCDWTALHNCVFFNHPEISRMLIEAGANLNIQNEFSRTALYFCATDNRLDIARMLVDAGADLNIKDYEGETALLLCARLNRIDIARMLVDAGADLNIKDYDGETALHRCVFYNRPEIARMLIDAGADVNIQRNDGWTALHRCAYFNLPEISRMLLDAGADKTIPNNDGKLPYELADTQELKELLKPFNENTDSSITKILNDIEQWMSGECIPFCVALNEIFPHYQIAVINDEFEDVDEDAEYNFNFVHAFCYHPNNHNIIIDARGVRKLKDLYEDFYDINPIIDWDIPNTKYLIDNYAGKEFASEESFEYDISEYQSAKDYISKNIQKYSVNLK